MSERPKLRIEMNVNAILNWMRIVQVAKEFPFFRMASQAAPSSGCGSCAKKKVMAAQSPKSGMFSRIKLQFLELPKEKQKRLLELIGADELEVSGYDLRGVFYKTVIKKEE